MHGIHDLSADKGDYGSSTPGWVNHVLHLWGIRALIGCHSGTAVWSRRNDWVTNQGVALTWRHNMASWPIPVPLWHRGRGNSLALSSSSSYAVLLISGLRLQHYQNLPLTFPHKSVDWRNCCIRHNTIYRSTINPVTANFLKLQLLASFFPIPIF